MIRMRVFLHKNFKKKYKKLKKSELNKFRERRELFMQNPFDPLLNNHALHGKYAGFRSIDITGDLRIHYDQIDEETAVFITIGSHSELY